MRFIDFVHSVKLDLYRYTAKTSLLLLLKNLVFNPGFKYSFWMRLCAYLSKHSLYKYTIFPISWIMLARYRYRYGIEIPFETQIGGDLYIGHFGGILVHPCAVIGKNFSISPGVVIGQTNRGERKGYPTIGDNVYVAPGAKVIGNINIGNNVAIGANAVVTKDIPDNAVVIGVPGRIVSYEGAEGYLLNPI